MQLGQSVNHLVCYCELFKLLLIFKGTDLFNDLSKQQNETTMQERYNSLFLSNLIREETRISETTLAVLKTQS